MSNEAPEAKNEPPDAEPAGTAPEETLRAAILHFHELRAYAQHFVRAKLDSLKLGVRGAIFKAVILIAAAAIGVAVIITAAVLFVVGVAQALSAAVGGRAWAGNLIIGGGILGGLALGIWLVRAGMISKSRARTIERYEQLLRQQREELAGNDVRHRAAGEPPQADPRGESR